MHKLNKVFLSSRNYINLQTNAHKLINKINKFEHSSEDIKSSLIKEVFNHLTELNKKNVRLEHKKMRVKSSRVCRCLSDYRTAKINTKQQKITSLTKELSTAYHQLNRASEEKTSSVQITGRQTENDLIEIPKVIYHFWCGEEFDVNKYVINMEKLKKLNPAYEVVLFLLPKSELSNDINYGIKATSSFTIKDLRKEIWYQEKFRKTPEFEHFKKCLWGRNKFHPAATDILKAHLINELGGIWNDIDNIPLEPLPAKASSIKKDGIYTSSIIKFMHQFNVDERIGSLFCTFGTHKNNEKLKLIIKQIRENLTANSTFLDVENYRLSVANTVGTPVYTNTYKRSSIGYKNDLVKHYHSDEKEDEPARAISKYSIFGNSIHPKFSSQDG